MESCSNQKTVKQIYLSFFKIAPLCLDDNFVHSWHSLNQLSGTVSNTSITWFPWFPGVCCHSISSVTDVIMSRPLLSSLLWTQYTLKWVKPFWNCVQMILYLHSYSILTVSSSLIITQVKARQSGSIKKYRTIVLHIFTVRKYIFSAAPGERWRPNAAPGAKWNWQACSRLYRKHAEMKDVELDQLTSGQILLNPLRDVEMIKYNFIIFSLGCTVNMQRAV